MKRTIGINIDGIIRNFLDRFEKVYISTYIHNPSLIETNSDMTEIKLVSEDEEEDKFANIEKMIKEKIKKPIDSFDLLNHFEFLPGKNYLGEEVDAQGKLEEFMYELKSFNIFGQAEAYYGAVDAIHKLQNMGEQEGFEVLLLSTLKGKAITATYSFLGNSGCRAKNIKFVKSDFDKWDFCDVIIDIMPETFQTKPEEYLSVKIEHEFNKWDSSDFTFTSLRDALKNEEFLNKLKEFYKK